MGRAGSVLLCVLLAAGLAACGSRGDKKPLPETVVGSAPTTTTTTTGGGGKVKGDPVAGKKVFGTAGCTSCHTLADAGATGTVGPSLDEAKPPYELVIERVTNGRGVMPSFKGQLTEKQIQDVAAYVSSVAGK
jgi:mono/diheme cytochrome c family protein